MKAEDLRTHASFHLEYKRRLEGIADIVEVTQGILESSLSRSLWPENELLVEAHIHRGDQPNHGYISVGNWDVTWTAAKRPGVASINYARKSTSWSTDRAVMENLLLGLAISVAQKLDRFLKNCEEEDYEEEDYEEEDLPEEFPLYIASTHGDLANVFDLLATLSLQGCTLAEVAMKVAKKLREPGVAETVIGKSAWDQGLEGGGNENPE